MGESGFSSQLVNTQARGMNRLLVLTTVLLGSCLGDKSAGHAPAASNQVPVSAAGAVPPYYSDYEPQSAAFSSSSSDSASLTDRQASIEAVLGAPVVITAFAAALFGGILSPLISEGLSRMADYQIEWPSIGAKETRRRRKKVSSSKARDLSNNISWLEILEGVNSFVSAIRTKRSAAEPESFSAEDVSF